MIGTNVGDKKVGKIKMTKAKKKKRDWVGIVHRVCRVCIFRTIEAVLAFMAISVPCLLIGSSLVPMLAFTIADGVSLTQSTNLYTALASWFLPVLFYTLLITAATFCIYKRFFRWLHSKITGVINKPEKTERNETL